MKLHDNRGSIPLALLTIIIVASVGAVVTASVVAGQQQARFDTTFEQSLQAAEVGLSRASALIESGAKTASFTIPDDPADFEMVDGVGEFRAEATKDINGNWTVAAHGRNDEAEVQRTINARVQVNNVFHTAAFGRFLADFNGGNGTDAYDSSAANGSDICHSGSTTNKITDPEASSQSSVQMCNQIANAGIIATNGQMKLKGQTAADSDGFEIHNCCLNPPSNPATYGITDPLPDAGGHCSGLPNAGECDTYYSTGKLKFFRDKIDTPDVMIPTGLTNLGTQGFSSTGKCDPNDGAFTIPKGPVLYQDVCLSGNTIIEGTVAEPSLVYLTGKLELAKQSAVNFERNAAGTATIPRPPQTLIIQSQYTNATEGLKFGGHASIAAAIYAPGSGFQGGPQGNVYGSLTASSIDNNGGWNFHYDVALQNLAPMAQLNVGDWVESQ